MPRGGRREGAGRPAGTPNKRTAEQLEAAQANGGQLPLAYMTSIYQDKTQPDARRDTMAIAAAPYLHAKLSCIAVQPPREDLTVDLKPSAELAAKIRGRLDAERVEDFKPAPLPKPAAPDPAEQARKDMRVSLEGIQVKAKLNPTVAPQRRLPGSGNMRQYTTQSDAAESPLYGGPSLEPEQP